MLVSCTPNYHLVFPLFPNIIFFFLFFLFFFFLHPVWWVRNWQIGSTISRRSSFSSTPCASSTNSPTNTTITGVPGRERDDWRARGRVWVEPEEDSPAAEEVVVATQLSQNNRHTRILYWNYLRRWGDVRKQYGPRSRRIPNPISAPSTCKLDGCWDMERSPNRPHPPEEAIRAPSEGDPCDRRRKALDAVTMKKRSILKMGGMTSRCSRCSKELGSEEIRSWALDGRVGTPLNHSSRASPLGLSWKMVSWTIKHKDELFCRESSCLRVNEKYHPHKENQKWLSDTQPSGNTSQCLNS